MGEKITNFRDLRIWQKSVDFVEKVYKITSDFPKTEVYGLVSQMQRAAVSVPSNIAEGFRRKHPLEYRQFLSISLGSCGELETQIEIAKRLGYIKEEQYRELIDDLDYTCKMIQALIKKIITNTQDSRPKTHD
ncbi:MAG: four helix bundle protein [Candidatus Omnitrophota bacterium]